MHAPHARTRNSRYSMQESGVTHAGSRVPLRRPGRMHAETVNAPAEPVSAPAPDACSCAANGGTFAESVRAHAKVTQLHAGTRRNTRPTGTARVQKPATRDERGAPASVPAAPLASSRHALGRTGRSDAGEAAGAEQRRSAALPGPTTESPAAASALVRHPRPRSTRPSRQSLQATSRRQPPRRLGFGALNCPCSLHQGREADRARCNISGWGFGSSLIRASCVGIRHSPEVQSRRWHVSLRPDTSRFTFLTS
jgi:hypothetical protein